MKNNRNIILDLAASASFGERGHREVIGAKLGDDSTRVVHVSLTDNGAPYAVPEGVSAEFRCLKPDGYSVKYPAVVNADGSVTVELSDQTLAAPGCATADICLTDSEGNALSSASFWILVDPVPVGSEIVSSNEYLELTQTLARGKTLLDTLETRVPVVLTQDEYNALRDAGALNPETLYLIARDDL